MKKTHIFSVVLAVALCIIFLGLVSTKAHAETLSSGTIGDNLTWSLDSDGTLTISGTGGIPASCASRKAPWYAQQWQIKTIIIDNGITSLPESAFDGYESLTKVTIADTVTSIGASAFANCRKLSDITLSKNLTVIEKNTFRMCYGLTEIVIPDGVTKICTHAFYDCNCITSITIPSNVTHVENGAFTSCNRLKDIYISDLSAWLKIQFDPNDSQRILAQTDSAKTLYLNNKPITALVIPDGIQEITPSAFTGCDFTSVSFPSSVTKIHDSAFSYCRNLTNIVIPDRVTQIGESAFLNCEKLTSVTIGNQVTSIGDGAFRGCTQLQQITIPNSVTSVGNYAFADCPALASATIGTGLAQMNPGTFSNCSSLATITIPGNVSTIGERAFENCVKLTTLTIGNGVTSIGEYAFMSCDNLTHISFSDSVTVICKHAFEGCSALQNIVFGKGLQVIEQSAFERCKNLINVEFPSGLTTIQSCAFYQCPKYEIVTLPASIKTIGHNAFYGVWHVLFKGTESQWNSLFPSIPETGSLANETVHFNCTGNELPSEVIAPTCTKIGYTAYTCSRCKEVRHNQLTDAIGHSYGSWYIAKEATFTNKGIERRDCKHCDEYETKDIPIKTHTDKNNDSICDDCGSKFCINHTEELLPGKSATCTQDGLTDGKKCANCNVILQAQEVIPTSDHSYGEWTPTTEGLEERVCDLCGTKEQQQTETPTSPAPSETTGIQPTTQTGTIPTEPVLPNKEEASKKTNPIVIVLIVTGVMAVAGGTTAVLINKKKK